MHLFANNLSLLLQYVFLLPTDCSWTVRISKTSVSLMRNTQFVIMFCINGKRERERKYMFDASPAEQHTYIADYSIIFSFRSSCVKLSAVNRHVTAWPAVQRYALRLARAKSSIDVSKGGAPHEHHSAGSRGQNHEVGSHAYREGPARTELEFFVHSGCVTQ